MDYLKTYCEKKASARTRRALRELKLKGGNIVSGVGLANRERTLDGVTFIYCYLEFLGTPILKNICERLLLEVAFADVPQDRCSLKISQNTQENTCTGVSLY